MVGENGQGVKNKKDTYRSAQYRSLCTTKSERILSKIPMWNESFRHCLASLGNTKEKCLLLS